jgi:hypothetical protein
MTRLLDVFEKVNEKGADAEEGDAATDEDEIEH